MQAEKTVSEKFDGSILILTYQKGTLENIGRVANTFYINTFLLNLYKKRVLSNTQKLKTTLFRISKDSIYHKKYMST